MSNESPIINTNASTSAGKQTQEQEQIKKVMESKLKLSFEYYKPIESINFIIEDIKLKSGKTPEKIACGEISGNKVYGLALNNQIVSPIGWIESKIQNKTQNKIELETQSDSNNVEYELVDFRTLRVEKK